MFIKSLNQINKHNKKIIILLIIVFLLLFSSFSFYAKWGGGEAPSDLFSKTFGDNPDLMYAFGDVPNIGKEILRCCLWWLITLCQRLTDGLGDITQNILDIKIFNIPFLKTWNTNAQKIAYAFATITIVITGIVILYKGSDKIKDRVTKLLLIFIMITFIFPGMNQLFDKVITPGYNVFGVPHQQAGTDIIIKNTYDVEASLKNGKPTKLLGGSISTDQSVADKNREFILRGGIPSRRIDQDSIPEEYKGYKSVMTETGYDVEKLGKTGLFGIGGQEELYQYNFSFWKIFLPEMIMAFTLFLFGIKFAKNYLFELGFAVIATILFIIPRSGTKKLMNIVDEFITASVGILISIGSVNYFINLNNYLTHINIPFWTQTIIQIGISAGVISGSQIINKLIGYDSGVEDGPQTVTALNQGANLAGKGAKGVGKVGAGLANLANDTYKKGSSILGGSLMQNIDFSNNDDQKLLNAPIEDNKEDFSEAGENYAGNSETAENTEDYGSLSKNNEETEGSVDDYTSDNGELKGNVDDYTAESGEVEGNVDDYTTENGEVEGNVDDYTAESGEVEGNVDDYTTENGEVEGNVDDYTTENGEVEGNVDDYTAESGEVEGNVDDYISGNSTNDTGYMNNENISGNSANDTGYMNNENISGNSSANDTGYMNNENISGNSSANDTGYMNNENISGNSANDIGYMNNENISGNSTNDITDKNRKSEENDFLKINKK